MRPLRSFGTALVATVALAFGAAPAAAQKALVYCPVGVDATGCSTLVTSLAATFPDGVDRGYDGTSGTVSLAEADLSAYALFVVPSLADVSGRTPYTALRETETAARLRNGLRGRIALWSGTPDQGTGSREQKDKLLKNLATWAMADFTTAGGPGLLVLQDNSATTASRYDWLSGLTGLTITADPKQMSYAAVRSLNATGTAIVGSGTSAIAYTNMASYGFYLPTGAAGLSLDAVGQTGTTTGGQVVLATAPAGNRGAAVISTDKDDYAPGEMVTMTGFGFGASEKVKLVLHEDPLVHADRTFETTTNEDGEFTFTGFKPEAHDLGVRFVLTATGQSSGRVAQTTFSDGYKINISVSAPSSTASISWSRHNTSEVCGGTVATSGNPSLSNGTVQGIVSALGQGQSLKLTAAASAGNGSTFTGWTVSDPTAEPGLDLTKRELCVPGKGATGNDNQGTLTFTATYSSTTQTAVSTVTATKSVFGGTTDLSAKVTPLNAAGSVKFFINGSTTAVNATYDAASGIATVDDHLHGLNASTTAYSVKAVFTPTSANYIGDDETNAAALIIDKAPQTITFDQPASPQAYGTTFNIPSSNLSANSGLTITLTPSGACTVAVASAPQTGWNVTMTSGTTACTLTASQAGNTNYTAATAAANSSLTRTVAAAKAAQAELEVTSPDAGTFGDTLAIQTTGGSGAGAVIVSAGTSTACSIVSSGAKAGMLAITSGTGNCALTATKAGDDDYQPITSDPHTVTVAKATPTFTFSLSTLSSKKFGDAEFTLNEGEDDYVNSNSDGAVTFKTGTGSVGCSVTAIGEVTITGAAVSPNGCIIEASLAETANYEAAGPLSQEFFIAKAGQVITFTSTVPSDAAYQGDAYTPTATGGASREPVTFGASGACTLQGGKVEMTGVGTCTVTADQDGNDDYDAAPQATQTFNVDKAAQSITFGTLDDKTYGDADFSVSATASSGLTVSFSSTTTNKCTISGTTVHIVEAGQCTIRASQIGNDFFKAASNVDRSFEIEKAQPAFSDLASATITYKDPKATLSGTIKAGALVPSGSVSITVNGQTVTASITAGTGDFEAEVNTSTFNANTSGYAITYAYTATTNFQGVSDATEKLIVNKADQVISWSDPADIVYGTPLGASQLNATVTQGDGALTYVPPAGTKLDAGTHTLRVNAAETGNYNAASTTVEITVDKAATESVVTCPAGPFPYTGTQQEPCSARVTGPELDADLAVTYTNNVNVGTATASASFAETKNHLASSDDATFEIVKANTTTSIGIVTPSAPVYGNTLTINFSTSVVAPGAGTPTGSVTVKNGSAVICTAAVGAGSCTYAPTGAGQLSLTAEYSGDASYNGSTTAATTSVSVARATTTTAITLPAGPSLVNGKLTIGFTVSPPITGTFAVRPTGTVEVRNGSTVVCSASVSAGATVSTGSCDFTPTATGSYNLSAWYVGTGNVTPAGDANFLGSNSTAAALTVKYGFDGFFAPVDKPNILNVSKAGQAIPLKWRVVDANGNPVTNLTIANLKIGSLNCSSTVMTDLIEEYAAGSSGLQNLGDGYYQYNWKTPTTYANTCKSISLDFGNGYIEGPLANFNFKK